VDGEVNIKPPKTKKSKRTLKIGADLTDALRVEQQRQSEQRELLGEQWNKGRWIVCREDGNFHRPDTFSSLFAAWTRRQSEIPRIRFHDLRHTHSSHLIWAGVPIKMISQRLGHETIQITLDTYGHLLEAHDQEAVERLEKLYRDTLD